jgi:hypothetical protein
VEDRLPLDATLQSVFETTEWKKLRWPKNVQRGRIHGLTAAIPVTETSNIFGDRG